VLAVALGIVAVLCYARARRLGTAFELALGQLERLQQAFHRFAPQEVVEDIIRRGTSIHAERREVTVLFADLVGFTTMSEHTAPDVIARMLNGYFDAMTRAIAAHNGRVGKFMGDGILAMSGAPDPNPWQGMDAVLAALAMRRALEAYNTELAGEGLPALAMGVGVHRGPVIAGVFGSQELMDYTVIGDVVNTASRIETLTRDFHKDILVSQAVADGLDERFLLEPLPPAEVKGKSEKLVVWEVVGFREASGVAAVPTA
jgi:adenylate cyclase